MRIADGLTVYVAIAPTQYDRGGCPYAGPDGIDHSAAHRLLRHRSGRAAALAGSLTYCT
jgi:hypothetical protein